MTIGYSESDFARNVTKEVEIADYRGEFGRDRDRVLFSSAFRRLAGKTQVVSAGEPGDFHTRITHSIKVAQLGRRISQLLQQKADVARSPDRNGSYPSPDPELVEAACLAHDLGHPPFGHAGETALKEAADEIRRDELLRAKCKKEEIDKKVTDYGGFEGNAQTFRILTKLSVRQPRGSQGLLLARATLDATIKYPWLRGTPGTRPDKWNVYPDDEEYANWVREPGPPLGAGARRCFEAQIMDWCDDVTYACHDVEDFYRAGLIPLDRLFHFFRRPSETTLATPRAAVRFFDFVEKKWTINGRGFDKEKSLQAWNSIGQYMRISSPYDGRKDTKISIHRATSALLTFFVNAIEPSTLPPHRYNAELVIGDDARLMCDLLQELIFHFVIERPALTSQQIGQQRIVKGLLRCYYDSERLLPEERQEEVQAGGDKLRVCIDHVASMTEYGASAMYQRLTGVDGGLHTDLIWRT